ncbi:MAG: hypothetical protein NC347_13825 [Clostridium sp.]|nr:hypothetical protein [Clostridium sp.]
MRGIWMRVQERIIFLSERHPALYGYGYLLCFVLMVAAGAALPDVAKSVFYPLAFEKQETGGIITGIVKEEVRVASGRPRKSTLPATYFEVDGFQILVSSSTAAKYQEGEWYDYYLYEAGDMRIAERKNYVLAGGVAGCFLEAVIFFVGAAFLLTETGQKEKTEKTERMRRRNNGILIIVAALILYWCSRTVYYFIMLL